MINISHKQAIKRYDTLPQTLKDAVWSPYINSIVLKSASPLDDYSALAVGALVGDVLMGFSNADDFGKNIKEGLGLEQKKADEINKEITEKIFTPLKAEIEKNYNPVLPEETEEAEAPPTPLESAAKEVSAAQPLKIETETPVAVKKVSPLAEKTPVAATTKAAPVAESVKAELVPVPLEPTIIHEEQASPLQKSINLGDFQIELPQSRKPVAAAVAAEFEMGNYRAPAADAAAKKPPTPKTEVPRVVHYSAYSTPLSQPSNQIKEIESIQLKPGSTSGGQAVSTSPTQANKNAFAQLGTKEAETKPLPPKAPGKSASAFALSGTDVKTSEKPAAKFINLNDFGTISEAEKNPAAPSELGIDLRAQAGPKGPEIKGNTIDLTK